MAKQNVAGKAGFLALAKTKINITKWDGSVDVKMADTTDSGDYDATTALVWNTQLPASAKISCEIAGNFDLNGSQTPLVTKLLSGTASAVLIELGLNATTTWGYAYFDVSNFKVSMPVQDTVTFTASVVSNGKFTLGAAP